MTVPTRQRILDQLTHSVRKLRGKRVETANLTEDALLGADLGLDSLDMLEVRFDIEDAWKIEISDSEAEALSSVRDVVDKILAKCEAEQPV
jgi:acyl carrier protein